MTKEIPKLFVIEGHQAGGKTTLGSSLGDKLKWKYVDTQKHVPISTSMQRYRAFLNENLRQSEEHLAREEPTIMTGYWITTIANHNRALGLLRGGISLPDEAYDKLLVPNGAIICAPPTRIAVERLEARGETPTGNNDPVHMKRVLRQVEAAYTELGVPYVLLDTDHLNPEETVIQGLEFIAEHEGRKTRTLRDHLTMRAEECRTQGPAAQRKMREDMAQFSTYQLFQHN